MYFLDCRDKQAANDRGSLLEQCQSGSDDHPTPMSMRSTRRGNSTMHGRWSTSVDVLHRNTRRALLCSTAPVDIETGANRDTRKLADAPSTRVRGCLVTYPVCVRFQCRQAMFRADWRRAPGLKHGWLFRRHRAGAEFWQ